MAKHLQRAITSLHKKADWITDEAEKWLLNDAGIILEGKEFETKASLRVEAQEQEPFEEDAFLWDTGPLGTKTSVSVEGKSLGEFDTRDEAEDALREWGRENKFYPTVWFISDHGNYILVEDWDWEQTSGTTEEHVRDIIENLTVGDEVAPTELERDYPKLGTSDEIERVLDELVAEGTAYKDGVWYGRE